ncbi:MAG: DM13 domain-containing protein [Myxococcota bacterium]
MMHRNISSPLGALTLIAVLLLASLQSIASPLAGGAFQSDFESFTRGAALSGRFEITQEGGRSYLQFGDSFRAQNAPDLKVFLSRQVPGDVTGRNATRDAVRLGKLQSFRGGQRYLIPDHVDLADFTTVIVHCEAYAKLWGTGQLASTTRLHP